MFENCVIDPCKKKIYEKKNRYSHDYSTKRYIKYHGINYKYL